MEQAVAQIVQPGDSPETKVRKIYARTQQIRNLSFEREQEPSRKTEREKLADVRDAEDIWKRGYGRRIEITWLFLALVRAAGVEARSRCSCRHGTGTSSITQLMNPRQLNSNAVVVKLGGQGAVSGSRHTLHALRHAALVRNGA